MGTCIDSRVRFTGTNQEKIAKALAYIQDMQEENQEYSGNGVCDYSNEAHLEESGSYMWSAYYKAGDTQIEETLRDQLLPLTEAGDFEFWIYWECMDGFYQCSINHFTNGKLQYENFWDDLVAGIDLTTAIEQFEEQPDAANLKVLIDAVASQSCSAWFEDEPDNLKSTVHMASLVYELIEGHPDLIVQPLLQESMLNLHASLDEVQEGLDEHDLWDELSESEVDNLRALSALAESRMLKAETAKPANDSKQATNAIRV